MVPDQRYITPKVDRMAAQSLPANNTIPLPSHIPTHLPGPGQQSTMPLPPLQTAGSKPQVPVEVVYAWIKDDFNGSKTAEILGSSTFVEGQPNILHVVAHQEEPQPVLEHILGFMKANSIDLGLRDAKNRSALEIAIAANRTNTIDRLLRAGASPHYTNQHGETPLHTAIRKHMDCSTIQLLLDAGADCNARVAMATEQNGLRTFHYVSTLDLATHVDSDLDSLAAHNRFLTIETLLKADIDYNADSNEGRQVYANFFTILDRSPLNFSEPPASFTDCLRAFLRRGADPFCQRPPCNLGYCTALSQCIFFHTNNSAILQCMVQEIDPKSHGQRLVSQLLEPCPMWTKTSVGAPPSTILAKLIRRGIGFTTYTNLLSIAFIKSPNSDKASLTKTLLKAPRADIHFRDPQLGRPLQALTTVPEPLRLELAEILLERDLHDAQPRIFIYDMGKDYMKYTRDEYKAAMKRYLDIGIFHQAGYEGYTSEELETSLRCVIHVLTKRIIEESNSNQLSTPENEQRFRDAHDIRKHYNLYHIATSDYAATRQTHGPRNEIDGWPVNASGTWQTQAGPS